MPSDIVFSLSGCVALVSYGRLFLTDARWAVEKHATLEAKHALVRRDRESARLVWSHLQVMFGLPVLLLLLWLLLLLLLFSHSLA